MRPILWSVATIALITILGCSATTEMGKIKVVEESGGREGWVKSDKDYFEKDERMYFRSLITDRQDLAYAKREAKGEAVKNITEKISIKVRTEFESAVRGTNVDPEGLSRFTADAVAWVSENLYIQGISPTKSYWQRVEKRTPEGYKYFYNVYVLCEIPIVDYEKARNMAIRKLLQKYRDEGNKQAEEAAEEVKQRLLQE